MIIGCWRTVPPFATAHRCCASRDGLRTPNWEQGWRSGESTRLPPMWPGFDSRSRPHMWVEFVVGSRPCSEGFSPGTPVFLPPQKPTFLNSNSTWKQWSKSHSVDSTEIPIYYLFISKGRCLLMQRYFCAVYECVIVCLMM